MVVTSILMLFLLGLVAATLLGISSRVLAVEEDPRVEAVVEALPGANCGGCGYAGCEGYAQAVVGDPDVPANLCLAGGNDIGVNVGLLTGKTVAATEPQISFRRCEKIDGKVAVRFEYKGLPSCAAASLLASGQGTDRCTYSCLGHGDCVKVCPFDALYVRDGLARINPERCTGCGLCARACPRDILCVIPRRSRVMVCCSSKDRGKAVTEICEAGCVQCLKCIRKCPAQAISLKNGTVEVDQKICLSYDDSCGMVCVEACPRGILRCLKPGAGAAHGKNEAVSAVPPKSASRTPVSQGEALS